MRFDRAPTTFNAVSTFHVRSFHWSNTYTTKDSRIEPKNLAQSHCPPRTACRHHPYDTHDGTHQWTVWFIHNIEYEVCTSVCVPLRRKVVFSGNLCIYYIVFWMHTLAFAISITFHLPLFGALWRCGELTYDKRVSCLRPWAIRFTHIHILHIRLWLSRHIRRI